ncbi:MAG: chromosomal replication initiator protein DnaA [Deltaproteobacteria bacterium]|nr:chromosomal replication initiator protein DnaA [Deltaproteobacteria bacterium]
MESIWPEILNAIEKRVNLNTFNTWFTQIEFIETEGDTVYLGVPNRFTRDWINDHGLKDIIQQEFSTHCSREIRIILRISESSKQTADEKPPAPAPDSKSKAIEEAIKATGLNPRYRFDDFVVGPSNQLAYAASSNVAENPASTYNPLFIYGGAGLGKTHLLNAIGHRILSSRPSARLIYASTETFVNELINSIRFMNMDKFRNKYRSQCDVLLIDDIQFISKKVRTQEEFFHTFNTLFESHRQIVISSDSYPQEIPELEDRLRTRFQWGLIADIQPPEIETRIAILQKKAENEGLDIPDDVSMFIASKIKSNVREIEGSLKRLGAFSSMYGKPITLDFAKDVLRDTLGTTARLSIEDVLKSVVNFFNVKISDIKGNRRHRSISRPRQITMYLCRTYLNYTYPDIGNHLNKDHSTAISAVRNVEKLIKTDPVVREAIEAIKRQLGL